MDDKTKNILNTMKAFSNVSQIPVTLLDENGEPAWACMPEKKFCSIFASCDDCRSKCPASLASAAETGETFSQYLTHARLATSIRMLKSTHLSITDIALACGFSNQSYYIKIFREAYGSTPKQYRDSI